MTAPAWVLRIAATRSGLDTRQGRHVRVGGCTRCHAAVFRGLDADRCAGLVTVDPYPLTPQGEACALLRGRGTYWAAGRPLSLWHRDQWMIRGRPADRVLVVADHVCGDDLGPWHRYIPTPPPPKSTTAIPPF